MKITWYGHSCFLLENSSGKKLLTDPFDPSIGYSAISDSVDIVTISHHHYDHDCTDYLKGTPKIIDSLVKCDLNGFSIQGIPCYHDKFKGLKRGKNIAYIYECDNIRICHLGDLGYLPNEEFYSYLQDIDVLLIPIGGNFTIDGTEAAEISKRIKSHIIIPMHYKTQSLLLPIEGAEKFISAMGNVSKLNSNFTEISPSVSEINKVLLLNCK